MRLVLDLFSWAPTTVFCASVVFCAGASVLFPWWESVQGRSLVFIDVMLAVALAPSVLHHLYPSVDTGTVFFLWYYVVSFYLVAGVTLWRLWALAQVQRRGRREAARRRSAMAGERMAGADDAPGA